MTTTKASPWPWAELLTDFLSVGYSEDLFWTLTPRQIDMHFAAAGKRYRRERNTMMETAYLAALAPNQKKPPALKDLLIPDDAKPKRRQNWQEIKAGLILALGAPPDTRH